MKEKRKTQVIIWSFLGHIEELRTLLLCLPFSGSPSLCPPFSISPSGSLFNFLSLSLLLCLPFSIYPTISILLCHLLCLTFSISLPLSLLLHLTFSVSPSQSLLLCLPFSVSLLYLSFCFFVLFVCMPGSARLLIFLEGAALTLSSWRGGVNLCSFTGGTSHL